MKCRISSKSYKNYFKRRESQHDYLAKIVIIGDSAVGKTNLLLRFANDNYSISHTPTIGVDFKAKIIDIQCSKSDKKKVKLQLWDTAGQYRFRTITETYYHGAAGIVIVYAVDNRKSFYNVKDWLAQIKEHSGEALPKIIVGNKCDLSHNREITVEEGRLLANNNNCSFMYVSAKENINVEQAFIQLAMSINFETPNASGITDSLHKQKSSIANFEPSLTNKEILNQGQSTEKKCCQ